MNYQHIYTYSRAQASPMGSRSKSPRSPRRPASALPVFITRGVYEQCVAVPLDGRGQPLTGQDEAGRLWDVIWMLRFAIIRSQPGTTWLTVALYVRNSDTHPARLTKLIATAGAVDIDDQPQPLRHAPRRRLTATR